MFLSGKNSGRHRGKLDPENSQSPDAAATVPSTLVYADLLSSGDPRQREIAEILRKMMIDFSVAPTHEFGPLLVSTDSTHGAAAWEIVSAPDGLSLPPPLLLQPSPRPFVRAALPPDVALQPFHGG